MAEQAEAAGSLLGEDEAGSDDQAVEESQPRGTLQEGGHGGVNVKARLTSPPVLQGRTGHLMLG